MQNQQINLGINLRKQMQRKNLTQVQLAKTVGMRKSTLHGYLYGVTPNGIYNLIKIADIFELSLDELILGGSRD